MVSRLALVSVAVVAGCGDPPARVRLTPVDFGVCGKPNPGEAATLKITAYSPTGDHPHSLSLSGGAVDFSDFPADTEQFGLELTGASGTVAVGKTAPIEYGPLANGATIPIAIAPLGGYCHVGALGDARAHPLVAPTDGGALVIGGSSGSGAPILTAELYDMTTGAFSPIGVPPELADVADFSGGVLTPLPDGRVVLTGTGSHIISIFDPKTRAFSVPQLLDQRAFQGAFAPQPERLFMMGGCSAVMAGACGGTPLHSSLTYHLDNIAMRESGPQLPDGASRIGASVFDAGIQSDGVHRYVLAGGDGDLGAADRFALADTTTVTVGGMGAEFASLDGGALLSAFGPGGAAWQLAPEGVKAVPIATAPALAGVHVISLEDGSVLAVGGDGTGQIARYVPTANAWQTGAPSSAANGDATGPLVSPSLARLADGTVLVLGSDTASTDAWIYRPSLDGPTSGFLAVEPGTAGSSVLTVSDPAGAAHGGGGSLTLVGDGSLALVGGTRTSTGSVAASITVDGSHVELLAQVQGTGRMLVGDLVAGSQATIARVDGTSMKILCTGQVVPAFDKSTPTPIGLTVSGNTATLTLFAAPIATCSLSADLDAADSGSWGLAAVDGTRVGIGTITLSR